MILAQHQRIVVGVDGSPSSAAAAHWAASVAERLNAPLHVAGAVPEPALYMGEAALAIPVEVLDEQRRTCERVVTDVVTAVLARHPVITVTSSVEDGPASAMMIELSRSARMVVVGNAGAGPIVTTLFGSTAQKTSIGALCPVVVWRQGTDADNAPVLVGIDGSATSEAAVEQAFDLASMFGVPLIAAHTWNSLSEGTPLSLPGSADGGEIDEQVVLAERLAGWGEKYPDVAVEHVVRRGNPAHVLIELSRRAGLVVVGSHGRGVVARTLFGSTSSNLTRHAHCPVMICRER